jgi:hypothetical protein
MGKETAEQKLLKLIEAADASGGDSGGGTVTIPQSRTPAPPVISQPASAEAEKVLRSVKSVGGPALLSMPPFIRDMLAFCRNPLAYLRSPQSYGLKEIQKALTVLIVFVFLGALKDFVQGMEISQRAFHFESGVEIPAIPLAGGQGLIPENKNIGDFLNTIVQRNIFQPYEPKEKPVENAVETADSGMRRVTEQAKLLKLVGVSWLDTPESAAAMIENTESGVTYFLHTGEIINDVLVEKIYADRIIVVYEGEEMELRL